MKKTFLTVSLLTSLATAQEAAPKADAGMTSMLMLVVMFAILWFFMIRPEQKKQKAKESMRSNIAKGDKVVTIGGICGTVTKVYDDRYVVQMDKENSITVLKAAIDRKDMSEEEIAAEKASK